MSQDPQRLDFGDDVPDLAKDALRLARADVPTPARLAGIEEGVLRALFPPPGGGDGDGGGNPAPGAGGTGGAGAIAKVGAAALAVAAGIGAIVVATNESTKAPPMPVAATTAPPAVTEPRSASTTTALPPASASETIPSLSVSDLPSAAVMASPTRSAKPSEDVVETERAEIALLDAAQAALASNPAGALAKVDEHARRFPRGTLVQEREVLAIDALLRLSRRSDAEARAEAFRKSYPRSGHVRRIDALLAR